VGPRDGDRVGAVDGEYVGWCVGPRDGENVGDIDGECVG